MYKCNNCEARFKEFSMRVVYNKAGGSCTYYECPECGSHDYDDVQVCPKCGDYFNPIPGHNTVCMQCLIKASNNEMAHIIGANPFNKVPMNINGFLADNFKASEIDTILYRELILSGKMDVSAKDYCMKNLCELDSIVSNGGGV